MAHLTAAAVHDEFCSGIQPFLGEYRAVSFRFLTFDDGDVHWLIQGLVTLEDLDVSEVPLPKQYGDTGPVRVFAWVMPLQEGLKELRSALEAFAFSAPGEARTIKLFPHGLAKKAAREGASGPLPVYSLQDRVQFHHEEVERLEYYKALRIVWNGTIARDLIPDVSLRKANAALADLGIDGVEQLVYELFGNDHYDLENSTRLEVFAPIRISQPKTAYDGKILTVEFYTGKLFDLNSLKATFHILQGRNQKHVVATEQLLITQVRPEPKGRRLSWKLKQDVPKGDRAKVVMGYKKEISLVDEASLPPDEQFMPAQSGIPGFAKLSTGLFKKQTAMIARAKNPEQPKRVFVVYGRNEDARKAMFAFLYALKLEPIEWAQALHETGQGSPYNDVIVSKAMASAAAVIVLLTGDDLANLNPTYLNEHDEGYERKPTPQARPNVLFEAGMAFATKTDKVIIVQIGALRPFSDVAGRNVVRLTNNPASKKELAQLLQGIGCPANTIGNDWLNVDFSNLLPPAVKAVDASQSNPRFIQAWKEFKELIEEAHESPIGMIGNVGNIPELKDRYKSLRDELNTYIGQYREKMFTIMEREEDKGHASIVLSRLIYCVTPANLEDWHNTIKREVPDELNAFDSIIYAAVASGP